MTRMERTFIACSDGILEMASINLGAQRGEQPLQLVRNGQRRLGGRFLLGSFARFSGSWRCLRTHRGCWGRDSLEK